MRWARDPGGRSNKHRPVPSELRVQLVVADEVRAGGVGVNAALLEQIVQRVMRPVEVDAELDQMRVPQPASRCPAIWTRRSSGYDRRSRKLGLPNSNATVPVMFHIR